jgi:hypothetical protein
MARILGSHDNLSIEQLKKFESENDVELTGLY